MKLNTLTNIQNKQYNAAILYLEKKEYAVKLLNSKTILSIIAIGSLIIFLFVLKFFIAF